MFQEGSLHNVAARAKDVGSSDVLVVVGDVANSKNCLRFVQATVEHFGRCKFMTISYLLYTTSNRTTTKIHGTIINSVCSIVVDHLVNNAGVANVCWFEEEPDVADLKQVLVRFSSRCAALFSYFSQ